MFPLSGISKNDCREFDFGVNKRRHNLSPARKHQESCELRSNAEPIEPVVSIFDPNQWINKRFRLGAFEDCVGAADFNCLSNGHFVIACTNANIQVLPPLIKEEVKRIISLDDGCEVIQAVKVRRQVLISSTRKSAEGKATPQRCVRERF